MYTKLIQRAALIVVGLLFIVPLAVRAAPGTAFSTSFPLLKRGFFQNNFIVLDTEKKPVTPVINSAGTREYWVIRDIPFTLRWDSKAPLASDDGQISSAGIFCSKSWEESFRANGESTGYLSSARTFFMTCSGLGGGIVAARSVKVGDIDLVVESVGLDKLTPNTSTADQTDYYANVPYTIRASVKNTGVANLLAPSFKVKFLGGQSQTPATFMALKDVDTLKGGNSITLEHEVLTGGGAGITLWFQVCADVENVVPERKNDGSDGNGNNCSEVKGPYKFVSPQ